MSKGEDYVGSYTGTDLDVMTESLRMGSMTSNQLMAEQYLKPEKRLRDAVCEVVRGGLLPYHKEHMRKKGNVFVCWDCNNGGLYPTAVVPTQKQPKGVISEATDASPLTNLEVHRSRGKHKGKQLQLLDMTGHQLDPIVKKIDMMKAKAAAKHAELKKREEKSRRSAGKDKGKASASVTAEEQEAADLEAENASLKRQLHAQKLREENQKMREELAKKSAKAAIEESAYSPKCESCHTSVKCVSAAASS